MKKDVFFFKKGFLKIFKYKYILTKISKKHMYNKNIPGISCKSEKSQMKITKRIIIQVVTKQSVEGMGLNHITLWSHPVYCWPVLCKTSSRS